MTTTAKSSRLRALVVEPRRGRPTSLGAALLAIVTLGWYAVAGYNLHIVFEQPRAPRPMDFVVSISIVFIGGGVFSMWWRLLASYGWLPKARRTTEQVMLMVASTVVAALLYAVGFIKLVLL